MNSKTTTVKNKGFNFFGAIGKFCVKWRWLILIVWVVGAVVIVKNLPSLSDVTQSDNSNFLPSSAPVEKAFQQETAFQPKDVTGIPLIVARANQPLTSSDLTTITQLESALTKVKNVNKVQDQGLSPDGEAEQLSILSNNITGFDVTKFVTSLRSAINSVSLPSGLQAHLAGPIATDADQSNTGKSQNTDIALGSALFIIVLLLLIFKAPLAPIVTLIPPLLVVTISGPIIAEAAHHGLKVSSLAQLLLTVLVLGAGTDYGLFLIFRVREELRNGLPHREAIIKALSRVGESITFSAATVIAALLSLLFATFQIYSTLGEPLAIGIAIMLLAGLTLLPALLAIFGRAVFWPSNTKAKGMKFGLWGRICARIIQKPALVLICGLIFFGALALAVPGYKSGGFGGNTSPPAGSDSAKGNALLAKHFPSSNSNPTLILFSMPYSVWQNPQILAKAQSLMADSSQFNRVTGPLNPNGMSLSTSQIKQIYQSYLKPQVSIISATPGSDSGSLSSSSYRQYLALSNYISKNGRTVQFSVNLTVGDSDSTAAMTATPAIRDRVSQIGSDIGATQAGVLGDEAAFYDINSISNHDLIHIIPIAIIVIGILLGILMRSLVAPVYLIISVIISYLAALGMAVLLFIDLGNSNGLVFILPFLMFIFLLALGEDYNILVMTRIREEAHSLPLRKAVTQALNTTGTTITSAGLVLAGTFAVLGVVAGGGSQGQQVRDIGFGITAGILMDTFLVRTLLVPSVVVLLGKWNWWPSKHGSWAEQSSKDS